MAGIPQWLQEHRELQALRAAASATSRPTRRKKKRNKVPRSYVTERIDKAQEVKSNDNIGTKKNHG